MKKNHCTATRSIIKRKKKEKKKPGRRRRVKEEKEKETEDVSISNSFFSQNLNQVIVSYEVFRLDCHSCLLDVTSISHPFSVYFLCVLSVSSKCCLAFTKRNIRKRDVPVMQKWIRKEDVANKMHLFQIQLRGEETDGSREAWLTTTDEKTCEKKEKTKKRMWTKVWLWSFWCICAAWVSLCIPFLLLHSSRTTFSFLILLSFSFSFPYFLLFHPFFFIRNQKYEKIRIRSKTQMMKEARFGEENAGELMHFCFYSLSMPFLLMTQLPLISWQRMKEMQNMPSEYRDSGYSVFPGMKQKC